MIRIGLYGYNGHQIQNSLSSHLEAKLVASAGIPPDKLPLALVESDAVRFHSSFEELIGDPDVDLVSLCSPRRIDQASDAIRAMRAGKHVLAEKPCAMQEKELDAILTAAEESGRIFHEMAGTAFAQPYVTMREIVQSGRLGEIVQVLAEKSYPYYDERAQDEDLDGGLILQNAVHAFRFVEHVACSSITSVDALETKLGNPITEGGLRMAASINVTLKNGGIASIAANYLNPRGTGIWGNEALRILGSLGMVESSAGGNRTRLVIGGEDLGPLDTTGECEGWLEAVLGSIAGKEMPVTLEQELSPTRWAIRANVSAKAKRA